MKFPRPSAAAQPQTDLRAQIQRAKDQNDSLQIQIQLTDEMIAGLALIRDGIREYAKRYLTGPEQVHGPLPERQICDGLSIMATNWGRRLQYEKNVLANAIAANQDAIRLAETGIVLPR